MDALTDGHSQNSLAGDMRRCQRTNYMAGTADPAGKYYVTLGNNGRAGRRTYGTEEVPLRTERG